MQDALSCCSLTCGSDSSHPCEKIPHQPSRPWHLISNHTNTKRSSIISEYNPSIELSAGTVEYHLSNHPHVKFDGYDHYVLNQSFAIVRHADRLDHTQEWHEHPDRFVWPNDSPLSTAGHRHASEIGHALANLDKPFQLIVSSPYYRCAETASRIAEVLRIPVHFDLDFGEIFDSETMIGDCTGKIQHRPPEVLKNLLCDAFPTVSYVCDESKMLKIEGTLQHFPESMDAAFVRYVYKVMKVLQKAASELMSVVIVTHADALNAVLTTINTNWVFDRIPFASYAIGHRQVKVLRKGADRTLHSEPVYELGLWKINLSREMKCRVFAQSSTESQQLHEYHKELYDRVVDGRLSVDRLQTNYALDVMGVAAQLNRLSAVATDKQFLLQRKVSISNIQLKRKATPRFEAKTNLEASRCQCLPCCPIS